MPLKRSDKTRVFEKALSILDLAPGSEWRVLDFGCGNGEFLGYLSQLVGKSSELIGIDAMENSNWYRRNGELYCAGEKGLPEHRIHLRQIYR